MKYFSKTPYEYLMQAHNAYYNSPERLDKIEKGKLARAKMESDYLLKMTFKFHKGEKHSRLIKISLYILFGLTVFGTILILN